MNERQTWFRTTNWSLGIDPVTVVGVTDKTVLVEYQYTAGHPYTRRCHRVTESECYDETREVAVQRKRAKLSREVRNAQCQLDDAQERLAEFEAQESAGRAV